MAMTRRGWLGGVACVIAGGPARAAGVPPSGRIGFTARRNGSLLGSHRLDFTRQGEALSVRIAVDYVVKLGPFVVFRYSLRGTETWQGETLAAAAMETDDDGTKAFMRASRTADRLAVEGSATGRYVAPHGAILATHWNRRELDGPMINPQNGELLRFTVTPAGNEAVAGGTARRFALTGPSQLDLWYDAADVWVALRAVAHDGSVITYERE